MRVGLGHWLGATLSPWPPTADGQEPGAFFAALDRFQQKAFAALRRRYRGAADEAFCKLLAVKVANAFAADYHFRHRQPVVTSRPVQLQVDPINGCQLRCPGCVHSGNPDWSRRFDWPAATLDVRDFAAFCGELGPFALGIALFRDGEPLLHPRFPEFVSTAKGYLLYTLTSTNLSMPLDAEALVASGLDRLVAAIDGATAATYGRFRRRGDLDLALENLRSIVRVRRALGSPRPWVAWQYLAFEHNAHEVEAAAALARDIGVDQFFVATPFAVDHDDPDIQVAVSAPTVDLRFTGPRDRHVPGDRAAVSHVTGRVEIAFAQSWERRWAETAAVSTTSAPGGGLASREAGGARAPACAWLYHNLTMDAARRVTPCCLAPMGPPEPRHLVYARFTGAGAEVVNSPDAVRARVGTPARGDGRQAPPAPHCLTCTERPASPLSLDVARRVSSLDDRHALRAAIVDALASCPLYAAGP